jgi:Zn-dependent metalloprotease
MKNKLTILLLVLIQFFSLKSQNLIDTSLYVSLDTTLNYYTIKPNLIVTPSQLLNLSNNNLKLFSPVSFQLFKTNLDIKNNKHYKYRYLYSGIPIENTIFAIHCDSNDVVKGLNHNLFVIPNGFNITPNFNSAQAITYLNSIYPNVLFSWQDTASEINVKIEMDDSLATNFPTPTLAIIKDNNGIVKLAYKLRVIVAEPFSNETVYLDASNGSLITKASNIRTCSFKHSEPKAKDLYKNQISNFNPNAGCSGGCHQISGSTLYYNYQNLSASKKKFGIDCKYYLKNTCWGAEIHTQRYDHGLNDNGKEKIEEETDQNNNFSFLVEQPAVTAHFCAENAWQYYSVKHSRNSYDDLGGKILTIVNKRKKDNDGKYKIGVEGAEWDGLKIVIGAGGEARSYNDFTSLDIIGHELTHGVTGIECDFTGQTYKGETGALDEALSDIFGTMIEFYGKAVNGLGQGNWQLGEDFIIPDGKERDMSNPKSKTEVRNDVCSFPYITTQPDTYQGNFWFNVNNPCDFGGVHINSGVINYWFYILSEGKTGINDIGNNYCVRGIGKEKAAQIVYHAVTNYINANSKFAQFASAVKLSSSVLFGLGPEYPEILEALYAVNLGPNPATLVNSYPYISIANKNELSSTNYNYNQSLNFTQYKINPSVNVDISSNIEIAFESYAWPNATNPTINREVEFLPNSDVSAYIAPAPCIGSARFGNFGNQNNISNQNSINPEIKVTSPISFLIIPNPTNGAFKVATDNSIEYPKQIIVRDVMGRNVKVIDNPISFETEINIETQNAGVYMISVYYSDKVLSKRIIKN